VTKPSSQTYTSRESVTDRGAAQGASTELLRVALPPIEERARLAREEAVLPENIQGLFTPLSEARQRFWEKLLSFPLIQEERISVLDRVAAGKVPLVGRVLDYRTSSREHLARVLSSVAPLVEQVKRAASAEESALLRRQIAAHIVSIPMIPENALRSATKVITQSELLARKEGELESLERDLQSGSKAHRETAAEVTALRIALGGNAREVRERVISMAEARELYKQSRETLYEYFAPIAAAYAKRAASRGRDALDIKQAASIGLLNALERVSCYSRSQFDVLTRARMRVEVIQEVSFQKGLVRIPGAQFGALKALRTPTQSPEGNRFLRVDEVGEKMGISREIVGAIAPILRPKTSLDSAEREQCEEPMVAAPDGETLTALEASEVKRKLMEALAKIPDDERQAISLRFGLSDGVQRSFPRISKIMERSVGTAFGKFNLGLGRLRQILSGDS